MTFWLAALFLTTIASLAVLLPLGGQRRAAVSDAGHDLSVYRDQLAEVDRDLERGAIAPQEAEQARAEIARRIVRLGNTERADAATPRRPASLRVVSTVAVLSIPIVSWGLYGLIGSPDLPSQPLNARLNKDPAQSTPEELIARAEAHLARNPDDGRGWDVLAPTYLRLNRFADAIAAYRNAIRLEGETAERVSGLAEAMTMANGGVVSAEADKTFRHALELEAGFPKARFFLAMGLAQDGRKPEAQAAWQAMATDLPADQPWRKAAEFALAQLAAESGAAAPGPTPDQAKAAGEMSPADRSEMIEGMVAGLDQKLRANPNDPDGWMRLVRSYVVLGRKDEAQAALKRAIDALGSNSEAGRKLAAFGAEQGLALAE
jgi:cytochrome c-type biogenesis protein CcmH